MARDVKTLAKVCAVLGQKPYLCPQPPALLSVPLDCWALTGFSFFQVSVQSRTQTKSDNDLCLWESPGKTTNLQVKGRGYIWKLPFEKMLSAALSLCAPPCHHSQSQTCHNMGNCQLGRPHPAVLCPLYSTPVPLPLNAPIREGRSLL